MVLELINVRVKPHVKVSCHPTSTTNKWSRNDFIDPEDDEVWDESDLTPTERGHIYLWKEDAEAWVHIFMPYRIMDAETAGLVKGFKTYRSTAPFVTGKQYALDKFAKNPKSCLQTFKFTRDLFSTFKSRVEALGGILEKDEIDVDAFVKSIQAARTKASEIAESISTFRETFCSPSGTVLDTKESKDQALTAFASSRESIIALSEEKVLLAKTLDRLSKEVGNETAYVEANEWFQMLNSSIVSLRGTDFVRLEREVIHKHRVDTGDLTDTAKPPTMMSLVSEIETLKRYYPSLQKLVVIGENVSFELPGLKITLMSDGSIKASGDPAILKPYIEGATSVQAQGRRRRAIYTKEEK